MKRAVRRLRSATIDYYDSQSGKRISWSQGVQRHGIWLSNKTKNKMLEADLAAAHKASGDASAVAKQLAELTTVQLGESMEAFTSLVKGFAGGRYSDILRGSGSEDKTPRAAALFAMVQAGDEVNAAFKLGASGVCIDVQGRGSLQKSKALIQQARALKLDVRCNLLDCFDYRSRNSTSQVLDLGILVGELSDVDAGTIILHDCDHETDIEMKKDSLMAIHDELIGIDCVGVPIKQRTGYYSFDAALEQWVSEELDTRHRLVFFD